MARHGIACALAAIALICADWHGGTIAFAGESEQSEQTSQEKARVLMEEVTAIANDETEVRDRKTERAATGERRHADRDADTKATTSHRGDDKPTAKTDTPDKKRTKTAATNERRRTVVRTLGDVVAEVHIEQARAEDVLRWYSNVTGIPIVANWKALENEGLSRDTRITLKLKTVPAGALLSLILQQLSPEQDMVYEITPWYLRIMTKNMANQILLVRVYDLSDIVQEVPNFNNAPELSLGNALNTSVGNDFNKSSNVFTNREAAPRKTQQERMQDIADLIEDTVEPEVWKKMGGTASVRIYRKMLIISAPLYVHRQIGFPVAGDGVAPRTTRSSTSRHRGTPPRHQYVVRHPEKSSGEVSGVQGKTSKVSGVR